MNWFEGEIAQAVDKSKTQGAIFVVYICGKNDKSTQITDLINTPEIAHILGSQSFVAIKIEAETISYQQFTEIYKQVPVPSIYFIGKQGVPLEIITEASNVKSFQNTLNSILEKGGLAPIAVQTQDVVNQEQSDTKPANVVCENGVCTLKKDKASTSLEGKVEVSKVPQTNPEDPELSPEEKVERAKKLVEKKREDKRKEDEENERQKEIERRKSGQSVQQLKRWQDDQELKNVLEERQKEKRESQAARERVLAQIAQDKAERAAKFSSQTVSQQSPAPPVPQQSTSRPVNTNTARLQFKMPDGSSSTNDFESSDILESVHAYIKTNLVLPFRTYTLSTTFPRREFTDGDRSASLLDLGLAPTAVILILPINRGAVATNAETGITGLFWSLITPILAVLGYLKSLVFGSATPPSNDNQNKRSGESSSKEPKVPPKIRRGGDSTVIRRQGNVHRLSNRNDSDDENNTWNGNSTQQM